MLDSLLIFGGALVGLGGVVWALRRAAARSQANVLPTPEAAATRRRRRDAPSANQSSAATTPTPPQLSSADAAALTSGLAKTRGGFVARLGKLFRGKQIGPEILEELEQVLFTADLGPRAAERIFSDVRKRLSRGDLSDAAAVWQQIRATSRDILSVPVPAPTTTTPLVILMIGVNGVGKTTTIGKLATQFKGQGKRVLMVAGDTFRAAATEQLEEWARRAEAPITKGTAGQDPSSVIFEGVRRGVHEGFDVVLCDTAGRLHSNSGLMDELKKIRRVCEKALPSAPHETWMVLDATTGQNAIAQAQTFKQEMAITGVIMTKLDGTAKGGVILGICDELAVPVRYIGVGESAADLRPFSPEAFLDALYAGAGASTVADPAA